MDELANFTGDMNALPQQVIENRSFLTPTVAFVKKHVDRVVDEVLFERH